MSEEISVRPGMAILHIAPEKGISDYFLSLPGVYYRPVDLIPSLYKHVQVEKMDLVSDAEKLPSNTFDVVFHSHVIEHIPSNYSAVLLHLHRSLKADGLHIFSIPIYGGGFEECLENIGPEERMRRFRQDDHVRRFGRGDIDQTIGKLFSIQSKYDLLARYPHIDLENMNVPTSAAKGYSSNSVFCLRKKDCYFFQ